MRIYLCKIAFRIENKGVWLMKYYKYSNKEIEYLKERDAKIGAEIDKIGIIKREINPDVFSSLISSIISQQISTSAALTVRKRLIDQVGKIIPQNINRLAVEDIQKCGMSTRKANYIKGVAEAAILNIVDFKTLHTLEDKEVVKRLTTLEGVGEWTAEMLLIHSLERPNILSYKDLGIRKGIMKLYNLEELSRKEFDIYQERYTPYCTVASLYLWEISSKL